MAESRIIPCLLLAEGRLVKTIGYEMPTYVGDPVNIVNIFSELEADEIIVLDIMAGRRSGAVDHAAVAALCEETSVPFGYGGGIRTLEDIRSILAAGAEKIILCTAAAEQPELVDRAASLAGSQAVVVSIDVRRERDGSLRPYVRNATARVDRDAIDFAKEMERRGAGEILLNAVDRDGKMEGFDLDLIRRVTDAVQIPVIAGCGAGRRADLREAVQAGASAAAAGSIFVFQGRNRSVVVNYPSRQQARALMS